MDFLIEHLRHVISGGGEGERAALLFLIEHGKACWLCLVRISHTCLSRAVT